MHAPYLNITQYVNWVIKYYSAIITISSQCPSLKIVDYKKNGLGKTIFTVQLSGKNIFPKFTAEVLFKDKELYESFNEWEQLLILQALPAEVYTNNEKRILAKTYDRKQKGFIFSIGTNHANTIKYALTLKELLEEKQFKLTDLNKTDLFEFGIELGKTLYI